MKASPEEYSNVAHQCNSYSPDNPNTAFTNSVGDNISCLNCNNLNSEGHCKLDLYDQIQGTD